MKEGRVDLIQPSAYVLLESVGLFRGLIALLNPGQRHKKAQHG